MWFVQHWLQRNHFRIDTDRKVLSIFHPYLLVESNQKWGRTGFSSLLTVLKNRHNHLFCPTIWPFEPDTSPEKRIPAFERPHPDGFPIFCSTDKVHNHLRCNIQFLRRWRKCARNPLYPSFHRACGFSSFLHRLCQHRNSECLS